MTSPDSASAQPSKTRRKKSMIELQRLGEQLVEVADDRLEVLALPEDLLGAIRQARRLARHDDARRRQMQYIGRLMRDVDPEPIREVLAAVRGESRHEQAKLHRVEALRDDLLADERALQRIAQAWPGADLQRLKSLRRAAVNERAEGRPPRNYRELFRALRAIAESDDVGEDDDGRRAER